MKKQYYSYIPIILNLLCLACIYPLKLRHYYRYLFLLVLLTFILALVLLLVGKKKTPLHIVAVISLALPDLIGIGYMGIATLKNKIKHIHRHI